MPRSNLRVVSAGLLAALFAWAVTAAGQVVVAPGQPGQPGKDKKGKDKKDKDKKDDRPPEDSDIPFGFPYDRDHKNQLQAAREYLDFKDVPWNTVCPLLQSILESRSDSFFNIVQVVGGEKRVHRISVRTEANRIIDAFPKEGLQFYQQLYGQQASAALDDAIKAGYDLPMLADLSQKFFHTKAGAEATVLLATLHLERGNYLEAAYAFERVLGRAAADIVTPRTLFKAALAFKRGGDPRHAEPLKLVLEDLRKATEREPLAVGRGLYPYEKLKAEVDRPLELLRQTTTVDQWAGRGGNPARSATVDGGPPFLDPTFRAPMFPARAEDEDANAWIRAELDKLFNRDRAGTRGPPLPAFFPVTTPDLVVYRGYNGVYAVATRDQVAGGRVVRAGEVRWVSKTTFGAHQMLSKGETEDSDLERNTKEWWGTYGQTKVTSVLYENPLLGTLAHDGECVYFVDDVAVPPPPVFNDPNFGGINPVPQFRQNSELAAAVRAGRLAAVDLKTGNVRWDLGRDRPVSADGAREPGAPKPEPIPAPLKEEDADRTTSAYHLCLDAVFLGAPLPLNGKLYVLAEQGGVVRLLCLDPKALVAVPGQTKKPALVWSQKLGRPNSLLPQDPVRRFQGCTLAAGDGIIVCPTNSGAVVAVDIMSRSLLWAHAYRKLDQNPQFPRRGGVQIDPNTGRPILPEQLKDDRWRAAGPVVSGGKVLLTAYDSDYLQCLDLRTGKLLWEEKRDQSDLYVGGVVNDRVIVVGKTLVKGYHLAAQPGATKPKEAFPPVPLPNATPTGHGVGGKGVFYLPVRHDAAGRDAVPPAELWAINVETGQVASKTAARKRSDPAANAELARYGLGNLVFQDGQVFAQSATELACFPQLELKKAEMNKLLAANPRDPVGLLARGELLLDDGKLADAVADFKAAQANNLPVEKQPLLREKLYVAYTEQLRNDFAAAEGVLPEYEALCEVPADDAVEPEEKVRRRDESDRRRRLYLHLVARGRETQGRLAEAFDEYMKLARLGEGKQLIDMPDEPSVRMRPDVWARGRIEGMVRRATDPAARKGLEDRVAKEWAAVNTEVPDLARLREFVAVFGPFFQTGADAQLLLAETLLKTGNEADAREAQTLLAQVRVTAEEPAVRARATEALARLMVAARQLEDAVGLYLQLGKDYPDVVVRDGKTGGDFLRSLLTDKRLLPYLEPSRYPLPTRVKAEQQPGVNQNFGQSFEIEPGGDLFPMYQRLRFVIDMYDPSGRNGWTLRAVDRATGAEKARFGPMAHPNIYNPGSFPFSRYVQGSGQLLMVQLGPMVYCYDLAEKKLRWDRNLLGEAAPAPNRGGQQIPQPGPDGEVTVKYDEGYYITLGRAAVLQPGYLALLTRDGLEVVEPATRRVLWTRRNMPERAQIYGDARHLVVVDAGVDRKPVNVQLLRAADGAAAEGDPKEAGRVLSAAKAFQILGRTALLTEGGAGEARVLRLYDLGTGKDVWKREYPAGSLPVKVQSGAWAGFVAPDGKAEVVDVPTGKVVAALQVDARNLEADLAPCVSAQLLADADRFYLFLDRDPSKPSTNNTRRVPVYNQGMRTAQVNGPVYAFDRGTGKRLWHFGGGLLENQYLVLEQFADLPVMFFTGPMQSVANPGLNTNQVVVIEKARGRVVLDRAVPFNSPNGQNFFQHVNVSPKAGTVDLNRGDIRILVSADDPKPAGP
jgi:outer membrane protein assembly factor BamB